MAHIPPDWSDLPTPGRQARQTLAGGTRIDRQAAGETVPPRRRSPPGVRVRMPSLPGAPLVISQEDASSRASLGLRKAARDSGSQL